MAPNPEVKLKKGRGGLGPAAEGAVLARGHGGAAAAAEPDPFTFATGRRRRRQPLCIVGRAAPLPSPPAAGGASGLPLSGLAGTRVGAEGDGRGPASQLALRQRRHFVLGGDGSCWATLPSSSSIASSFLQSLLLSLPGSCTLRFPPAVGGRCGPTAVFS